MSRQRQITVLRLCLFILLVGLLLTAVSTPGVAHAYLSETDPANGDQRTAAPDELTLTFSGDGVQVATVVVTGPDGTVVGDDPAIDSDDRQQVEVPIEDGGDGMYTVRWEILADDGHTTTGSFFFSVGDEPLDRDAVVDTYVEDEDEGLPLEAGAKGLLLLSLIGLGGIPVTAWVALYPVFGRDPETRDRIDHQISRLLGAFAALLVVAVVALGLARSLSLGGQSTNSFAPFLGTSLGTVWLLQLTIAGAIAVSLLPAIRRRQPRAVWLLGTVLAAVALQVTVSWTSHSATAFDRLQGTAVDFAHVAGAGLWVGGLLVLAVCVPPLLSRRPVASEQNQLAAAVIRRYSIVALTGVTLAVTTGLVLAAWHAPTASALSETLYGTVLSTKTALVFLALGLGGGIRYLLLGWLARQPDEPAKPGAVSRIQRRIQARLFGRPDHTPLREDGGSKTADTTPTNNSSVFRRAVRLEVTLLVIVIVLSGLLTSVPTAAVASGETDQRPEIVTEGADLTVTLKALPAHESSGRLFIDENEPVVFDVSFERNGERVASERPVSVIAYNERNDVSLEFELEPTEDGQYSTVQVLPETEGWELRIEGEPDGQYTTEWFDAYVIPYHPDHVHHDHGDETGAVTPFSNGLQLSALLVGILGSLAVTRETVRFGRQN